MPLPDLSAAIGEAAAQALNDELAVILMAAELIAGAEQADRRVELSVDIIEAVTKCFWQTKLLSVRARQRQVCPVRGETQKLLETGAEQSETGRG